MTARELLERPYRAAHESSLRQRFADGRPPRTFAQLLGWASRTWALEVPDRLHVSGVWRDYGPDASGGSALGAPRVSDPFRAYIEGGDRQTDSGADRLDPDAAYLRPMHAALSRLHGHDTSHPYSPASHRLFALAVGNFDLAAVSARTLVAGDGCSRLPPIPPDIQRGYWSWALGLWWSRYEDAPPLRTLA